MVDWNEVYSTGDLAREGCVVVISLFFSLKAATPFSTTEPQHSKRKHDKYNNKDDVSNSLAVFIAIHTA